MKKSVYTLLLLLVGISACKKDKDKNAVTHLNPDLTYGSVMDVDGNKYATIQIGNQEWMAENLRTTRYSNGDTLSHCIENWRWYSITTGAWCNYNNDPSYDALYGKLYNWTTTVDPRNICPQGWHAPSNEDWTTLINFLGGTVVAGKKMKSTIQAHWLGTNGEATNESGFSALPSGGRASDGNFMLMSYRAPFWSTTESGSGNPWASIAEIFWDNNGTYNFSAENKKYGYCIRCLKD